MKYPIMGVCIKTEGGNAEIFVQYTPPELYLALQQHAPRADGDAAVVAEAINVSKSEGILVGKFVEATQADMYNNLRRTAPFAVDDCYDNERSMPTNFDDFDLPKELFAKAVSDAPKLVSKTPKK